MADPVHSEEGFCTDYTHLVMLFLQSTFLKDFELRAFQMLYEDDLILWSLLEMSEKFPFNYS